MSGRRHAVAIAMMFALAGCVHAPRTTLYDDLGAHPGIEAIVDGLLLNLLEDARINRLFADADIIRLREKLIEQFCAEAGGPCVYRGESMEDSHAGLDIDEAAFNALVEDLLDAMDALDVPVSAQNRLIARLAPMRGQILHR